MMCEESTGAAPLADEDGNAIPMTTPTPSPSPSPSLSPSPSPAVSGAGAGAVEAEVLGGEEAVGVEVVPVNEEQSPPVARNGGAAVMSDDERRAREAVEVNPYDVDAWNALCNETQTKAIGDAASIYEQLLSMFPTSAKFWRLYVEAELAANDDDAVKQIFSRCLPQCLHVDIWRAYLRYMRTMNDNRGPEGREEVKKTFEFMFGHIGFDINAGPVWLEYISFLKAAPAVTPQEESFRMTAVRKAYQKAILAPVHLVEQIWKEYESFENSVSRALAKGLLAEYQPKHFSARAVYRERKKYCDRIDTNMLAVPPTGSYEEEQQCIAWKQLLTFEKGNPQRLDPVELTKHVAFTYEQCLMYLYHYSDIWYDFATWHAQNGSLDSAAVIYQRALTALPDTAVLHYAYAEFEETRGGIKGALQAVLERKDMEIKKLTEELEFTLWEHEAESSIYLEVFGERACEWRQLIDNLPGDFSRKKIVRRKELQASSSFSGRTQKDNLAFEDASPHLQGDIEGLKSAFRKPSPLKGLSSLSDQAVSSPGKATDPIYVVVRRNTQAAVEGFMVDIGESPSKRTNKEVVSTLKLEVLDLRREKEQLIDLHTVELKKLEFELRNECERMKVELEQECQDEVVRLKVKLESQHRKEAEQIKKELNQKFQIQITNLQEKLDSEYRTRIETRELELKQRFQNETTELQEKLELGFRNLIEKNNGEVEQNHRNKIADLLDTLELEHRKEVERVQVELQQKHELDLAHLQQKLDYEATKISEWKSIELEQKFHNEIAALEDELANVKQKLEQGSQDKKTQQSSAEGGGNVFPGIPVFDESSESSNISLEIMGSINETLLTQFESEVVTLVTERDELRDKVSVMELHISGLQEKVTKLEGERSWLEERVPGLEKKLATEQSRLEDTVAGHAFERDQLKLIVSSHKNEQTKLENELAERKAERNNLATAIAMLTIACRNLKVSNQNERERWRSAYMMALKDMERALSRTQKQVKEERAQKGSAESDAQRMKAEIYTMQQESKDVWRLLERTIAEHISRAVGTSQQVEFGLCRKIHQQTLRFEAVQQQVDNLLQVFRRAQMSELDYLHTVENLQRAEQEVDVLGDEVDSLVALLEKVHVVMDQYAPVLLHYPGVAEVAKLVEYELSQRDLLPNVPA